MQVTAFSTAARPEWRWRICDYGGETIEESHDRFLTIAAAVAQGAERLAHMNAVDRARAARGDSTTVRAAGAGDGECSVPIRALRSNASGELWVVINDADEFRWDNVGFFFLRLTTGRPPIGEARLVR